jgi:alanine dehydrogenase
VPHGRPRGEAGRNSVVDEITLGVVATSRKEHERRLPLHPRQLAEIDPRLRARIRLERGYGEPFQVPDSELAALVGGVLPRDRLIADSDIVLLPKPTAEDVVAMRPGQILCGWAHLVQDPVLTQLAIDRRLTVIAWESMNHWARDGGFGVHVFQENNELAGYCSVVHAMELRGMTGEYGRKLSAAVVSFGATGRGAVTALMALGVREVSGLTRRPVTAVADPIHGVEMFTFVRDPDHPSQALELDGPQETVAEFLAEHDVVVNCVLQDPDRPLILISRSELDLCRPGTLFVDVACDEGMGFEWARPTTFADPIFDVGGGRFNYGVDHSPSLMWDSATWEISQALIPHLGALMSGPSGWDDSETVARAIEVRDGTIQNPKILSFQGRDSDYPHEVGSG